MYGTLISRTVPYRRVECTCTVRYLNCLYAKISRTVPYTSLVRYATFPYRTSTVPYRGTERTVRYGTVRGAMSGCKDGVRLSRPLHPRKGVRQPSFPGAHGQFVETDPGQ